MVLKPQSREPVGLYNGFCLNEKVRYNSKRYDPFIKQHYRRHHAMTSSLLLFLRLSINLLILLTSTIIPSLHRLPKARLISSSDLCFVSGTKKYTFEKCGALGIISSRKNLQSILSKAICAATRRIMQPQESSHQRSSVSNKADYTYPQHTT